MIDKLAKTVLKQVKDEYPYVAHPAAMRAEITKAEKLPEEYSYEISLKDKETGELRTTAKSSHCFLNKSGKPISLKRMYPELDTKFFEFKEA